MAEGPRVGRSACRAVWGLLIVLLALWGAGVASAAPGDKEYTATASPAVLPAGSSATISIAIRNLADPQSLGSANVSVPAGIAVTASTVSVSADQPGFTGTASLAGSTLQLRNLALLPGRTATVTLTGRAVCDPTTAPYVFTTAVKQSNDFNGDGNDFVISGPQPSVAITGVCHLAFLTQPADSQKATDITSVDYTPTGAPVQVEVVDGSGTARITDWPYPVDLSLATDPTGRATLSGYVSAPAVSGVATFFSPLLSEKGPRIDLAAPGYRLAASSSDGSGVIASSGASDPFLIVDDAKPCQGNGSTCTAEGGDTGNTDPSINARAKVSSVANAGDRLRVSVFDTATVPPVVCGTYAATSDVLDFDLLTSTGGSSTATKTVVFTLEKAFVNRAASKYDVCWQAPTTFRTKSGATSAADPNIPGWYVGLLPTCNPKSKVGPPCVKTRAKDSAGNVVVTINAPGGDPRGRI